MLDIDERIIDTLKIEDYGLFAEDFQKMDSLINERTEHRKNYGVTNESFKTVLLKKAGNLS